MLEVYSKDRKKLAILNKAMITNVEFNLNALSFLDFCMPKNDYKNKFCQYHNLIRLNNIIYRIIGIDSETNPDVCNYHCEHILAKLIDSVMFGAVVVGGKGIYTSDVINFVLKDTDFILGRCDFKRQFEYGWEQENKLKALFDIPNRFVDKYKFDIDTSNYPYVISLIKLEENSPPHITIQHRKNMLKLIKAGDTSQICTKLYCLGAGEGVNQVNIKAVNGGVPYLLASEKNIQKYGIVERVLIDRRYKKAESLLEYGRKLIDALQTPYTEYEVDYANLKSQASINVGDIIEIIDGEEKIKRFVTRISLSGESNGSPKITIANKPQDIAKSIADLADRQRIEMAYSQGATQLYSQSLQNNADSFNGLIMDFYIPKEATIINSVQLKTRMSQFRAFSKSAKGGEAVAFNTDTLTLLGSFKTDSQSINLGGLSTGLAGGGTYYVSGASQFGGGSVTIYAHSHSVTTSNPSLASHSHSYTLPQHSHPITLPNHTHDIDPGIYFFGNPTYFDIIVNDKKIKTVNAKEDELEITQFLVDETGMIPRDKWLKIEIKPNDLAYISLTLAFQGYIQSRGDYTV